MSPNLLLAVSFRGNVGFLTNADLTYIGFVNVDAHTQHVRIPDRQHGVGDRNGIRNALPTAMVNPQDDAIDGRLDDRLLILGRGFSVSSLCQPHIGFGKGNILFA